MPVSKINVLYPYFVMGPFEIQATRPEVHVITDIIEYGFCQRI